MSIIQPDDAQEISSDEFEDFIELFGDDVPTDPGQVSDSLFSGLEG